MRNAVIAQDSSKGLNFMMRLQLRDGAEPGSFKIHCRALLTRTLVTAVTILSLASLSGPAFSADPTLNSDSNPQLVTPGTLFICGGGNMPPQLMDRFIDIGGGKNTRLVIVTTASSYADQDITARLSGWYDRLAEGEFASLDILHARSREEANEPAFSQCLETATAVWFVGGNQNWVVQTYLSTKTEERFHAVLERGGVIGGSSAGAAIMSKCMIAGGKPEPILSTGLGFLPGTIVDQHFRKRERLGRLTRAMEMRPGLLGIGIDEGTALILQGRTMEVMGESDVCLCLAPSQQRPERVIPLGVGQKADIVALRRAAVARATPTAIAKHTQEPAVRNGTLVIVGGGTTPPEAINTFLTAAGGGESPIVVVSNAGGEARPEDTSVCGLLNAAGAKCVQLIHPKSESELADPKLIALLKEARGVWFTGGRQWRLVDAFLDTNVEEMFHDVLRRGGVIGGTSAGATIQGEYLVRGNPVSNEEISAEGYERGFGFLPGVAIDQHFTQRNRLDDMAELKKVHPELLGLGVDESTALVVRGTTAQVIGQHNVTVFDGQRQDAAERVEFAVLKSGDRYDLRQRRRMTSEQVDSTATIK